MPRRSTSRDRSRSKSPYRGSGDDRRRHHRRSPVSSRNRRSRSNDRESKDDIERLNPTPSKVLGVFGLSSRTEESDLKRIFSRYGRVENIHIVYDRGTGRSRGFGFIYYEKMEDAKEAKKETHGSDIDGQKVRVDFSLTDKPHDRTPGIYMGAPVKKSFRGDNRSSHRYRSRSRSPRRYRSRSRSPRRRSRSRS